MRAEYHFLHGIVMTEYNLVRWAMPKKKLDAGNTLNVVSIWRGIPEKYSYVPEIKPINFLWGTFYTRGCDKVKDLVVIWLNRSLVSLSITVEEDTFKPVKTSSYRIRHKSSVKMEKKYEK